MNKQKLTQLPRLSNEQLTQVWGGINRNALLVELDRLEKLLRTTRPSNPPVKR